MLNVIDSIHKFKDYSRENKHLYLRVQDYLSQIYSSEKEYKKIANLDKDIISYLNNYNEESISKHLQLLSVEFDTQSKEQKISSLSDIKKSQEIKINNYQLTGLLLLVLLTALIFFFLYYRKSKNEKTEYEKNNLKQRLMLMQMNPHFIFNVFSAINGKIISGSDNTTDYVQKLSYLFRTVLRNSREEYITMDEEIELLNNYLEIQSDFLEKFKFKIEVENSIERESFLIPPMIVQPLLENAIEHGIKDKKGMIKLTISLDSNDSEKLIIKVIDNGIGFNEVLLASNSKRNKSFSISIIKERLKILSKTFKSNFELKYENSDSGTVAYLSLPLVIDG